MEIDEENKGTLSQRIEIRDISMPFAKFNIAAGSIFNISGNIMFESDKPIECMTLRYDKEPLATFNYFSCKTCKSNCILIITNIEYRDM